MRIRILKLLLFAALWGAAAVLAQNQQQDDQDEAQEQVEQEQVEQEQTEAEQEESSEEAEEDEEFARFIPTEQVSRDLGVSFPADI